MSAAITKTVKRLTPKEMLAFMIQMASYPYKMWMSGPSGGSTREKGSEWLFSYGPAFGESHIAPHSGCVYAPTAELAIQKAMRLLKAQQQAAEIVREAAS